MYRLFPDILFSFVLTDYLRDFHSRETIKCRECTLRVNGGMELTCSSRNTVSVYTDKDTRTYSILLTPTCLPRPIHCCDRKTSPEYSLHCLCAHPALWGRGNYYSFCDSVHSRLPAQRPACFTRSIATATRRSSCSFVVSQREIVISLLPSRLRTQSVLLELNCINSFRCYSGENVPKSIHVDSRWTSSNDEENTHIIL